MCTCVSFKLSFTVLTSKMFFPSLLRYTLRNRDYDDVCEELVLMLTDTLNGQLIGVGPEDVLTGSQLEELQYTLTEQVTN